MYSERKKTVLVIGRTSVGKSTICQHLGSTKVVIGKEEGPATRAIDDDTAVFPVAEGVKHKLEVVDTPGLFDERVGRGNEVIFKEISQTVERKHNYIDAVYLVMRKEQANLLNQQSLRAVRSLLADGIEQFGIVTIVLTSIKDMSDAEKESFMNAFRSSPHVDPFVRPSDRMVIVNITSDRDCLALRDSLLAQDHPPVYKDQVVRPLNQAVRKVSFWQWLTGNY